MNRLLSISISMDGAAQWLARAGLGGAIALGAYWLFALVTMPKRVR